MKDTYRLIYPPDYDVAGEKPWGNYDFIHSLQIDDMVVIPQENYRGGKDLSLEKFFFFRSPGFGVPPWYCRRSDRTPGAVPGVL